MGGFDLSVDKVVEGVFEDIVPPDLDAEVSRVKD